MSVQEGTLSGTLTIVFTDIVGSTELAERVGDLRFHEAVTAHKGVLSRATIRHGGRVVKDMGDGLMLAFPSARAAVVAAAEMQQGVGHDLPLKVGIHTGEAVAVGEDLYGRAVNVAARVTAAAVGGEVLLSSVARAVVDSGGDLAFDVPRWEALKGIEGDQELHPLRWPEIDPEASATAAAARGPAEREAPSFTDVVIPPPTLLAPGAFEFAGRAHALRTLEGEWAKAVAGDRCLVLLAGEPGVGKTGLAGELARRVAADDGWVLAGRCDEDLGVAYLPFVEALRHCCAHVPPAALAEVLGRSPGELRRLWPGLGELAPTLPEPLDADPETQRYRLYEAVASWLSRLSLERPVLLVLDDLHWATQPTLQLLRHLMRTEEPMRLLLCATYRDTDLGRTHPLADALGDLRRMPGVTRIGLDGLAADEVESFLAGAAGHALGPDGLDLAKVVHRQTGGNALFVAETLRHLVESGRVYRDGERWRYDVQGDHLGVPEGLREVVGRRLSRLGEATNGVLRIAAVVGLEFDERVVEAAGGGDAVSDALTAAIDAGVVTEAAPLRYRFAHAVLKDTLYEELRSSPRIRAHLAVAQAIESVHADRLAPHLADLAHHYAVAAPAGHSEAAVRHAVAAAHQAEASAGHDAAAKFYDLALESLEWDPDDHRRADLLLGKGAAMWRMNNIGAARLVFEEVAALGRRLHDPELLARAAVGAAGGGIRPWWLEWGRIQQWLIDLLEEALEHLPETPSALRAELLSGLARELAFTPGSEPRRRRLRDEAVEVARSLDDDEALARTLCAGFLATCDTDGPDAQREIGAEVIELAQRLGNLELAIQGHYELLFVAVLTGDGAAIAEHHEAMTAIAASLAQPFWRWLVVCDEAMRCMLRGRFDDAERLVYEAKELADEAGEVSGYQLFGAQMFVICQIGGREREAFPIEAWTALRMRYPTTSLFVINDIGSSWIHGDDAAFLAKLEALASDGFAAVPDDTIAGYGFAFMAWMVWQKAAHAYVGPVYERLLRWRGRAPLCVGPFLPSVPVDAVLAALAAMDGRPEDAEVHLGEAEEFIAGNDTPYHELIVHAARAELLLAAGDLAEAVEQADLALQLATAMGDHSIPPVVSRVRQLASGEAVTSVQTAEDAADVHKRTLRARLRSAVEERAVALVARYVAGASDEQLEARFGSARVQRTIVEGMARGLRPELRYGFVGEIGWELSRHATASGPPDIDRWTVEVRDDDTAVARPGPPTDPAVVFRCSLPEFVRMAAGVHEPVISVYEQRLKVDGDLLLATRSREMFGGVVALSDIQPAEL